jgi:probable rRNA maturation factor
MTSGSAKTRPQPRRKQRGKVPGETAAKTATMAVARTEPAPRTIRRAGNKVAIKTDIVVESKLWARRTGVRAVLRRAVNAAAAALVTAPAEVAIVLTDDEAIRQLNHVWRGADKATNVLSFPAAPAGTRSIRAPHPLGDIVLAYQTIAGEAGAERKPFDHHLAHLTVHGFLHLLGYDHIRNAEAEAMEQAERDILRRLAIPDPYRSGVKPGKAANRRGKA